MRDRIVLLALNGDAVHEGIRRFGEQAIRYRIFIARNLVLAGAGAEESHGGGSKASLVVLRKIDADAGMAILEKTLGRHAMHKMDPTGHKENTVLHHQAASLQAQRDGVRRRDHRIHDGRGVAKHEEEYDKHMTQEVEQAGEAAGSAALSWNRSKTTTWRRWTSTSSSSRRRRWRRSSRRQSLSGGLGGGGVGDAVKILGGGGEKREEHPLRRRRPKKTKSVKKDMAAMAAEIVQAATRRRWAGAGSAVAAGAAAAAERTERAVQTDRRGRRRRCRRLRRASGAVERAAVLTRRRARRRRRCTRRLPSGGGLPEKTENERAFESMRYPTSSYDKVPR